MLREDLFRMARGWRTHGVRFAFVGVLLFITALVFPWEGLRLSPTAGRSMMLAFVWLELIAAAIFIPAFVAPAIAGEREKGTLDLLTACPQSDSDLVFGRGMSHAAWGLSLLLAGAPFAVGAMVIGGAPLKLAAMAMAHAALMGTFSVTVALASSVTGRTAVEATTTAFTWLISITGLGAVVSYVALSLWSSWENQEWMLGFFFVGALAALLGVMVRVRVAGAVGAVLLGLSGLIGWIQVSFRMGGSPVSSPIVDRFLAVLCPWGASVSDLAFENPLDPIARHLAWGSHFVFCVVALFVLRRIVLKRGLEILPEDRPAPSRPLNLSAVRAPAPRSAPPPPAPSKVHFFDAGVISPSDALHGPRPKYLRAAAKPQAGADSEQAHWKRRKSASSALPVWDNPVLWKDVRIAKNPVSGCLIGIVVSICGLLTIPMLLVLFEGNRSRGVHQTLVIDLAFLGLVVAPMCASVFSKERDSGNLAILLSCGYPARSVVLGKFLAVLWHLRAPVVLTLLRIGLCVLGSPKDGLSALAIFATSIAALAFVSVAVASFIPNPRAAVAGSFVAGIALWAGPFFLELLDKAQTDRSWLSPVGMLFITLEGHRPWSRPEMPGLPLWLMCQVTIAAAAFVIASLSVEQVSRS